MLNNKTWPVSLISHCKLGVPVLELNNLFLMRIFYLRLGSCLRCIGRLTISLFFLSIVNFLRLPRKNVVSLWGDGSAKQNKTSKPSRLTRTAFFPSLFPLADATSIRLPQQTHVGAETFFRPWIQLFKTGARQRKKFFSTYTLFSYRAAVRGRKHKFLDK